MPLPDSAFAESTLVQRTLRLIEPDTAASRDASAGTAMEELNYDHAAEAAMLGAPRTGTRGGGPDADVPTAEQIDALRPYVLNLRMGRFSANGLMTSSEADVAMIVDEHLRPEADAAAAEGRKLRIVLYAHGGLVKESRGLATAQAHVGWWRDNGVYPIHFVWETGLFETIRGLLERAQPAPRQRGTSCSRPRAPSTNWCCSTPATEPRSMTSTATRPAAIRRARTRRCAPSTSPTARC